MTRLTALIALPLLFAAPARADQVHFTGVTTVDAVVIRDALQNILMVAVASERCNALSAVEASVLPPDYRPPAAHAGAHAGARYERWDVTLCGRVVPFLLGFWNAPDGGTMIEIGYPYPADPSPRP